MKSNDRKLKLTAYDDIFETDASRQEERLEKVRDIPLTDLHPFKDHPFKVVDDEAMIETAESIKQHGILVPAIARPRAEGGYELVAGHRRKRASELAGLETLPVIIRDLDDDAATIIMVDSNIQWENILPSERAFAYKLKLEALKRQVGRPSRDNGGQVDHHLLKGKSRDIIAETAEDSPRNIQRYIRLTEFLPDLLDRVDDKQLAFNSAVELSYLKVVEQFELIDILEMEQTTPSLSQAQRLKKLSQEGTLTPELMSEIISAEKKGPLVKVTLTSEKLKKYFPKTYSTQQMEEVIIKLLDSWDKKRQQSHER